MGGAETTAGEGATPNWLKEPSAATGLTYCQGEFEWPVCVSRPGHPGLSGPSAEIGGSPA